MLVYFTLFGNAGDSDDDDDDFSQDFVRSLLCHLHSTVFFISTSHQLYCWDLIEFQIILVLQSRLFWDSVWIQNLVFETEGGHFSEIMGI